MQRKPGFPVANCSIKMPDSLASLETVPCDEDWEPVQRRQQLINFGHCQWGFNNWSWAVSKQDLDFVDLVGGKYCVGVAAFVSVTVKSLDIHRENVGYATSHAPNKGSAIHNARKCAVTNALRETLLSFGGNVATELMEQLEAHKNDTCNPAPDQHIENNQNIANRQTEPKNSPLNKNVKKDSPDIPHSNAATNMRSQVAAPAIKNAVVANAPLPVAKAHPMPANLPPAANRAPRPTPQPQPLPQPQPQQQIRPNSNESASRAESIEEEARAERKRRQRQAQEEFRQKQMLKQKTGLDEDHAVTKDNSSFDSLLMAIPTQDIVIEETGNTEEVGKRKSPARDGGPAKRRPSFIKKLDMISD